MIHPDTFVGAVAVGLSIFVLGSAIFNWQPVYKIRTPRWIESRWGRSRARLVLGIVGTILFFIGCYLLFGFAPRTVYLSGQSKSFTPVPTPGLVANVTAPIAAR